MALACCPAPSLLSTSASRGTPSIAAKAPLWRRAAARAIHCTPCTSWREPPCPSIIAWPACHRTSGVTESPASCWASSQNAAEHSGCPCWSSAAAAHSTAAGSPPLAAAQIHLRPLGVQSAASMRSPTASSSAAEEVSGTKRC